MIAVELAFERRHEERSRERDVDFSRLGSHVSTSYARIIRTRAYSSFACRSEKREAENR